jgi:hypothetical protein
VYFKNHIKYIGKFTINLNARLSWHYSGTAYRYLARYINSLEINTSVRRMRYIASKLQADAGRVQRCPESIKA